MSSSINYQIAGVRIRLAFKIIKNLPVKTVARILGVSDRTIGYWYKGEHLNFKNITDISKGLAISYTWFLQKEEFFDENNFTNAILVSEHIKSLPLSSGSNNILLKGHDSYAFTEVLKYLQCTHNEPLNLRVSGFDNIGRNIEICGQLVGTNNENYVRNFEIIQSNTIFTVGCKLAYLEDVRTEYIEVLCNNDLTAKLKDTPFSPYLLNSKQSFDYRGLYRLGQTYLAINIIKQNISLDGALFILEVISAEDDLVRLKYICSALTFVVGHTDDSRIYNLLDEKTIDYIKYLLNKGFIMPAIFIMEASNIVWKKLGTFPDRLCQLITVLVATGILDENELVLNVLKRTKVELLDLKMPLTHRQNTILKKI